MPLDWPNPVREARAHGYRDGATWMRNTLADAFATYATSHPDPVVSDELWTFVNYIRSQVIEP